jgi:hypothetical protein
MPAVTVDNTATVAFGATATPMKEEQSTKEKTHSFTIFVNNTAFKTEEHQLTGTQIKQLAAVPPDYELFEVKGDQTVPVGNDQEVKIHENLHFRAIPAGTFGACVTTA